MAIELLLIALLSGVLITYIYDDCPPLVRLCGGAAIGLTLLGFLGYLAALLLGMRVSTVIVTGAILSSSLFLLFVPEIRDRISGDLAKWPETVALFRSLGRSRLFIIAAVLAAVAIYLARFFAQVILFLPDGLYTADINNYGDLPFHIGIISGFLQGQNYPPQHPEMAGSVLTYHFIADMVAVMLMRAGMTLKAAFFAENILYIYAIVGLIYWWTWRLFKSRAAALIAPLLVLFSGGLGFLFLFHEAHHGIGAFFGLLLHPPHQYTITVPQDPTLRWGNSLTCLFMTQRAMLPGMALFVMICTLWWTLITRPSPDKAGPSDRLRMAAAGVLAGLLPLANGETFLVVMGLAVCLAILNRRLPWLIFFATSLPLAAPQLYWLSHGSGSHLVRVPPLHWGWNDDTNDILGFWIKNTGVAIPLIAAALLLKGLRQKLPKHYVLYYLPFLFCFAIPNVMHINPWPWDDIKILFPWYIASAPLIAFVLVTLWRRPQPVVKIAAVLFFASLVFSGLLDTWRVASGANLVKVFDMEEMQFAAIISADTPPKSVLLNAPTCPNITLLTGRRSFIGFPGHLWTEGLDTSTRVADATAIYTGAPNARALIAKDHIDYVVVGPRERSMTPVNDPFFAQFPLIASSTDYKLYDVRPKSIKTKETL